MQRALPGKLVDAFDIVDYIVTVTDTQGMKSTTESWVQLLPNAESKPLYPVVFETGDQRAPSSFPRQLKISACGQDST